MKFQGYKRLTKKAMLDILDREDPTLILHIQNVKCEVDVNPDVYNKNDFEYLNEIVTHMSKDIWIDKTYVSFKKNRWRDAFIVEERWYDLVKLLTISTVEKLNKKTQNALTEALMLITITYLYQIAEKFGFEVENIDIQVKQNSKIKTELFQDNRTSWNS